LPVAKSPTKTIKAVLDFNPGKGRIELVTGPDLTGLPGYRSHVSSAIHADDFRAANRLSLLETAQASTKTYPNRVYQQLNDEKGRHIEIEVALKPEGDKAPLTWDDFILKRFRLKRG
jgi:hypothetical protein